MDATTETLFTAHHGVVIDYAAHIGVGIADDLLSVPAWSWWQSRRDLDVELRVLGYAVVALLPDGRFLVGPAPDAVKLWGSDELPVYAAGAAAVEWHPALVDLWPLLDA